MWNCIREKTGSNRCLLFYAGEFIVGFLVMLLLLLSQMSLCHQLHVLSKCSDWNGSKRGHVYKFLRSQGFVSSYDIANQYTDSYADAHKVNITLLDYCASFRAWC